MNNQGINTELVDKLEKELIENSEKIKSCLSKIEDNIKNIKSCYSDDIISKFKHDSDTILINIPIICNNVLSISNDFGRLKNKYEKKDLEIADRLSE